jgi:hypothetical protein
VFLNAIMLALPTIQAPRSRVVQMCHHIWIYLLPAIVGKLAFRILGARRQVRDLGAMGFALFTEVHNLSSYNDSS